MKNKTISRLFALTITLVMVFSLAACGGGGESSTDPNAGKYTAVTAEALGLEMEVSDLFGDGFIIELKDNGKCTLLVDGESANGKWTLDGSAFTVNGGGVDGAGTLSDGVMVLEDMLGMGVTIKFLREGTSESFPESNSAEGEDTEDSENSGGLVEGEPYGLDDITLNGIEVPSDWYGVLISEDLDYRGDVWAKFREDSGNPYFEVYEDIADFRGESDYLPALSMYIDNTVPNIVIPIADGNAWFLEHDLTVDDVSAYMGILSDGMLYFSFDYDDGEGGLYGVELYLRESGAAWDEEHDPLPESYDTYKDGF